MLEELKTRIDNDKQVLSILPQETIRNKKKYKEKVLELLEGYKNDESTIFNLIQAKNTALSNLHDDPTINKLGEDSDKIFKDLVYFNEFFTPYEIFNLDYLLHKMTKYYNENLEEVNNLINEVLNIFNSAGIMLSFEDFFFGFETQVYMQMFLSERMNGNYNSEDLKETFVNSFSKCPELISNISMNFKYLYYKNEKVFENYLLIKRQEVLGKYENSYEVLLNKYKETILMRDKLIDSSKYLYTEMFKNKEISTKDFIPEKMDKLKNDMVTKNIISDQDGLFNKYYHSLIEYKDLAGYKYIIEEVNKLVTDKDKNKGALKNAKKEIDKKESAIKSLFTKRKIFILLKQYDKVQKLWDQIPSIITGMDVLYDNLDLAKVQENASKLTNDSSLKDYLNVGKSYLYLKHIHKGTDKEETDPIELINNLNKFMFNPYNNLIDNMTFMGLEKLNMVIYDKYKMLGINLTLDSLDLGSIDGTINTMKNIVYYNNMKTIGVDIKEVDFIMESNDIIEKRKVNV